jgi:putative membrane protein
MSRPKFDPSTCESLTSCVAELEKTTDAEVVIAVRARSGNYRHADYLSGAILALAGLLFLVFSPFDFHPYWFVADVIILFGLGAYVSSRSNSIRRLLTRRSFRREAARRGAAAMFYEAGIANTNAEMGVLVYISLLERRLELIADRGVLKGVPALEWNQILFELHQAGRRPDPQTLLQALRKFGALLAKYLPATGENPNELPDMPRFELK